MRILISLCMVTMLALMGCATVDKALDDVNSGLNTIDSSLAKVDKAVDTVANTADRVATTIDRTAATVDKTKDRVAALPEKIVSAITADMKHTVVKGDTLWGISMRDNGDPFSWYGIYKANRDQIADFDLIEPGWNLEWNRREAGKQMNRQRAFDEPAK